MNQSLKTPIGERDEPAAGLDYGEIAGRDVQTVERRLDAFVAELRKMTRDERIRASRYSFNRWERWVYAARFPEEVPLVNDELEWIAATLE
jgi:hypothetical protein